MVDGTLGYYGKSLVKIKTALRLAKGIKNDSLYADLKLFYGRVLARLGKYVDAVAELTESYAFYRRANDRKSLWYPLNNLAQLHYMAGQYRRCCDVLNQSLRFASKYNSQASVDMDKRNLARVLIYMGDLSKSKSLLDANDPDISDRSACAHMSHLRGMICLLRLEYQEAHDNINSALHLFKEIGAPRDGAVCLEYLGLLEYTRGNYSKAREYYQKVLDMPEPTASAVAQTLRMLTDVYIAEEKFDLAEETAAKAEAAITRINERIELGALYRAYGQIQTHKREAESARDNFKKSIDLLREIGARYELALSYFAAGKSESYSFDERLHYLQMSRMLFIEMDVPKRVEQVESAITELRMRVSPAQQAGGRGASAPTVITGNRQMKEILAAVERIKDTSHTVLITGETGTGKDLLAEYIHRSSTRADKPFRIVNTAAIPSELLESELFGFRKGTYTGATHDKAGLIESAEGGTFYFDEIGDAPPDVQTKILRVLDTKSVRRLGTTSDIKVDVRFIAATNLDLKQMMKSGHFRSDLYYRLQEMPIHLPPLRDRLDDIKPLVEFFLQGTGFDGATTDNGALDSLIEQFSHRDWPGNIRELKFGINRLWLLGNGDLARIVELAAHNDSQTEHDTLLRLLDKTNWNRREVARRLGVSETTIRNRMKKYNL